MSKKDENIVRQAICLRTANARIDAGYKEQKDMAIALGILPGRYNKYETRGPLPHNLIIPFCKLVNVSPEWLLTGRGPKKFIDHKAKIASIQAQLNELQGD